MMPICTSRTLVGLLILFLVAGSSPAQPHVGDAWRLRNGRLQVSENGRHLVHANGSPFLWIGDTAWELFHRLDREEAIAYLEDRRARGFTVIQAVLLAEMDGLNVPNAHGHRPLQDNDPTRPAVLSGRDNDYWDHVDTILDEAARRGLVMALVPTWGEWVTPRFVERPVFKSPSQGYRYGNFLGKRYRRNRSLVWILGGDRRPDEQPHARAVWQAMAEGIADGVNNTYREDGRADYSTTLMTYHSMNSSSRWWGDEEWLDFNAWGTYHREADWPRSFAVAGEDWARNPPRPTLNAEPCYEEMARDYVGGTGFFDAADVRHAAYWSVLSGSFGFTYGAHPVWQMWTGTPPKVTVRIPELAPTRMTWKEALALPGAVQMHHLRTMMLTRPFEQLRPDPSLLNRPADPADPDPAAHVRAARGEQFAWFYSPHGRPIYAQCDRLTTNRINAFWYDPRRGEFLEIGNLAHRPVRMFDPPGEGREEDWLLLLEDETAGFAYPQ